jgi:4-hydroxybenzoate polyprenyltransferase
MGRSPRAKIRYFDYCSGSISTAFAAPQKRLETGPLRRANPPLMSTPADIVPDSERRGFVGALPPRLRPYASLMRLDRPIGTWLLYWPCTWSVALAGVRHRWDLFLWLALGAFAMRSAGCVYNDFVDRDLDVKVERTRLRPLASGRVSLRSAAILIALLCLIGLVVLLQLNVIAAIVAVCSIAPVALYPFMKRITWWPQAWLGIVFSWGAWVGWPAVTGSLGWTPFLLWFGSIAWVVGYDTLYAIQDIEDDALVGVKSSARRLGDKAPVGVAIFYAVALVLWGAAIWSVRADWFALLALVPAAIHLANQALRADPKDGNLALRLFRSNRTCGLLVFLGMLVVGLSPR